MPKNKTIDCQGLACPQPVLKTRDTLIGMGIGETLEVLVDTPVSSANVQRFALSQGHKVKVTEELGRYRLTIRKEKASTEVAADADITCVRPDKRTIAVYISSEAMGRGDDELGCKLMAVYLDTLTNFAREISHILLVNGGVKLAVGGAKTLDSLTALADMGIDILACGTCLNHFGLTKRLAVGQVSNMYTILEVLTGANKVISP